MRLLFKIGQKSILVFLILAIIVLSFTACSARSLNKRLRGMESNTEFWSWPKPDGDTVLSFALPTESNGNILLKEGDSVALSGHLTESGSYRLVVEYRLMSAKSISDSFLEITMGSDRVVMPTYAIWKDASKDYNLDRYGNEIVPEQMMLEENISDYVRNSASLDLSPVQYDLSEGDIQIQIKNIGFDTYLFSVKLVSISSIPQYSYYQKTHNSATAGEMIVLEGEDYAAKSDPSIRTKGTQNSSVYPYSPYRKLMSTIDSGSYDSIGQRVIWNFKVPESACYYVAFHYSQPSKEGQSAYRNLEIDGKTLFREMNDIGFPYTGNGYDNKILTVNNKPARIYLEAGQHTLSLYTQASLMQPISDEISSIIAELSDIGLNLQQIAGDNADATRTWDIEDYFPDAVSRLRAIQKELQDLYAEVAHSGETEPSGCVNLKLAAGIVEQVLKKPNKLPLHRNELSSGSGSASELLATLQATIRKQGLGLDCIYLCGNEKDIPKSEENFMASVTNSTKRFFHSLVNRNSMYGAGKTDEKTLNVWVNRSVTYVESLQQLIDARFTPQTGIEVQLSVMPDAQKLLLANASSTCPDVALGVPYNIPYELALRGAAADLNDFPDLSQYVDENFFVSDLNPYIFNGKLYALPETMQFYVLMYRKDIMDRLGLDVPDTWDDVGQMMSVLRRNGMNFYLPLSADTGVKGITNILPFFIQREMPLYDKTGTKVAFQTEDGICAFKTLTDLYSIYSVQNNVGSFYNSFRYGTIPIGVCNFTNYMQIVFAAPEIADSRKIALAPGTKSEDGTVNRAFTSAERGSFIMQSSQKKEDSWKFLTWWMSADVQNEYCNTMLTKFGSEFIWNSANKQSFSQLPFSAEDRAVIMEQWSYADNFYNLPVTYMLQRELSDAWYQVVQEGVSPRLALNSAATNVDSELKNKLIEFNFIDANGNPIKEKYQTLDIHTVLEESNTK